MKPDFEPISVAELRPGPDFNLPAIDEGYRVIGISHLRDSLGLACRMVAETEEPLVVQRYSRQDVAIVPLWIWRYLLTLVPDKEPNDSD